jgi:hypothetical protein
MKGATAELWAKTINPSTSIRTKIMGVSHHHFLLPEKEKKIYPNTQPSHQTFRKFHLKTVEIIR